MPSVHEPTGVVASTGIATLLTGAERSGHVLGTGRAAAYLLVPAARTDTHPGGHAPVPVVAVEAPGSVGLPLAVGLPAAASHRLAALRAGMPVQVGHGRLVVGAWQLHVARWRDPRPALATTPAHALARRAADAVSWVAPVGTDPFDCALDGLTRDLVRAAGRADPEAAWAAADAMLGRGSGSTPGGDDVLAGFLAAGVVLAPAATAWAGPDPQWFARLGTAVVAHAITRTPALSAALLWHATRGQVVSPAAALLRALCRPGDVSLAMAALSAVGHTSGTHLARGILAAAVLAADLDPPHVTAREHHARTPGGSPRRLPRLRQPDAGQSAAR